AIHGPAPPLSKQRPTGPLRCCPKTARRSPTESTFCRQASPPGVGVGSWSREWTGAHYSLLSTPTLRTAQRHLDDLGQVQGLAVRHLGDLLAATEAIGDDQCVPGGRPHRRQQDALP